MVTIEGAYAVSMEKEIGSLKPGKYADLVVLSANPLTVPPDEIKDIEVLLTMVNGRVEYCAPIYASLCTETEDEELRAVSSVSGDRDVVLVDPQTGGESLLARPADLESRYGRARIRA
jgi:urease alpha subunit